MSWDASRNPTEVINLVDEDRTCQDLEDFPIFLLHAVGANLGSSPVICGGQESIEYSQSSVDNEIDTCFKLINGQWKPFTIMNDKRAVAAGVVYQNTLHIFGGLSGEEPQYGNIKTLYRFQTFKTNYSEVKQHYLELYSLCRYKVFNSIQNN